MKTRALANLTVVVLVFGCDWPSRPDLPQPQRRLDPLPVQHLKAYPEAGTGRFVSLADFEDAPGGPGHRQVQHFTVGPPAREGLREFAVNVTRTGIGAMRVVLAPEAELIFHVPHVRDFSGYTLLSMALYGESLRDDLRVSLTAGNASWTSHRTLVKPGWNTVLIDIRRLRQRPDFDMTRVGTLRLAFADATAPVAFYLDDVMLIDNRRRLEPAPAGVVFEKAGLDYTLTLPHWPGPLSIVQHEGGLWRLSEHQPVVQLARPGEKLAGEGESLEPLGERTVGRVEILEINSVRLRLSNTWYFPTRAGEWVSLAVRKIRWEYTFYPDGRWVSHLELNNAGGEEIGSVRISLDCVADWSDGERGKELVVEGFTGPVGRWSYLLGGQVSNQKLFQKNYLDPGRIRLTLGRDGPFASGDVDRDGFDESQGCYFLAAKAGNCRFEIIPPAAGLASPVFRVAGPWFGPVHVNSEGLAIRNVADLPDGSVLFSLPGLVRRPTAIEVTSEAPPSSPR